LCNVAKLAVAAIKAATARKVRVIPYSLLPDASPRSDAAQMHVASVEASLTEPVNGACRTADGSCMSVLSH